MTAPLRVLVLWFPDWPLRAALSSAPPHPPVALVQANIVVACTASAREHGVRVAQKRRDAQGRLPALRLIPHDPARDERAFLPVLRLLEEHAPGISLLRPGLAALRSRGISRFHGGEAEAAHALQQMLADEGYPEVRVGIADGAFTAELAARGPSPYTIVPAGGAPEFLAPLPVQVLRDERVTDLLLRLGVRTLADFAALDMTSTRERLGEQGARLQALAAGADSRPLTPRAPDPELVREVEFDSPLGSSDQVAFAVRQTADAVLHALDEALQVCTEARIDLTDDNGAIYTRSWLHPTCFDASDVVDRVRWQLESLMQDAVRQSNAQGGVDEARAFGGIVAVRIVPVAVDDVAHHQPGLFGAGTEERLHHAVSRVQTMLGHRGVVTAARSGGRWLADRQVLTPWGERAVITRDPAQPWPSSLPDPLPTEVFRPPRAITVLAEADAGTDSHAGADPRASADSHAAADSRAGTENTAEIRIDERGALSAPPARIEGCAVHSWAGPWPVQEHGWDAPRARRGHRFQIVDDAGRAWLVFHASGRWWAEGRYR